MGPFRECLPPKHPPTILLENEIPRARFVRQNKQLTQLRPDRTTLHLGVSGSSFACIFFAPSIVNAGTRPTSTHPSYTTEHSGVTSFLKDKLLAEHLGTGTSRCGYHTTKKKGDLKYVCSAHQVELLTLSHYTCNYITLPP